MVDASPSVQMTLPKTLHQLIQSRNEDKVPVIKNQTSGASAMNSDPLTSVAILV